MEEALKLEERVRSLESDVALLNKTTSSLEERVSKHGLELDEMAKKNSANEAILGRIDKTVSKIDEKLDEQQMKPAKRWETLVAQITALVVAAIVGMALANIGLQQ